MISLYKAHIDKLAKELNCQLDIDPKFKNTAMMYVEENPPRIEVPTIVDQITYLTNLHELGHVFHGHTQGRPPHETERFYFDNGVLHSEAQAWEWALDNCIDEIQSASRLFMWNNCLGSYYLHGYIAAAGKPDRIQNGNRHHVEFIYDEPDAYFTSIVKRIQGDLTNYTVKYEG
jgi:hypothetical protein